MECVGEHIHVVFVHICVFRHSQNAVMRRQSIDQQLGEGDALVVRDVYLLVHANTLDDLQQKV